METMEIDDHFDGNMYKNLMIQEEHLHRRNKSSRCSTICLVFLCAVLLAGNVGQIIFYEIVSRPATTNTTQANNDIQINEGNRWSYNQDGLTVEKDYLQIILSNLTKEKDQLQQHYKSLTTERDELEAIFKTVTKERDQFRSNYNTLQQESAQLQTSYNDMQKSLEGLQSDRNNLTVSIDQLQTENSNLHREKNELQTHFNALAANRDQLESNYSSLRSDRIQLQNSLIKLHINKSQMESSYRSLWQDKNQMQTRISTLMEEMAQLETKYSNLATDKDQLQKHIDKITLKVEGMLCPPSWRKFDTSCYFVSSEKKNWTESRKACIAEGADLTVINSHGEQVFVNGLLFAHENAWIGLTDSLIEGTWMWVDGSPINETYWQVGQPNGYTGDQDCGEFVQASPQGVWNDDGCFAKQIWICEK
ncbi:asialoglycoprotein receptor 1-like [Melanotaenia boesemani]|uniref:asialoglycoprotein receptor 1-like n=1 Tax=Melanotaenia boesemani TaxID=1250792 RepID=UPI001C046F20|nr:asialoglycoprotein receptor 1-like [Melanotaenia boesemani]